MLPTCPYNHKGKYLLQIKHFKGRQSTVKKTGKDCPRSCNRRKTTPKLQPKYTSLEEGEAFSCDLIVHKPFSHNTSKTKQFQSTYIFKYHKANLKLTVHTCLFPYKNKFQVNP